MEKEKSKNTIIVILAIVILVLSILLTLIFTGVISLNGKNNPVENTVNTPSVTITMEEAKEKVKDVVSNKKWKSYECPAYTNPGKTGRYALNVLNSEDLGFEYEGQTYTQST